MEIKIEVLRIMYIHTSSEKKKLTARWHTDLGEEHLYPCFQQEHPTSHLVNRVDGDNSGEHIDGTGDDSRVERCIALETQCVEQNRCVEHDGVNSRELLEYLFKWNTHDVRKMSQFSTYMIEM